MQIGEQDQSRTEEGVFRWLRLFHLDHQVCPAPGGGSIWNNERARCGVFRIGNGTADPGAGLNQGLMAVLPQHSNHAGHTSNPRLVILNLFVYADDHCVVPPLDKTTLAAEITGNVAALPL